MKLLRFFFAFLPIAGYGQVQTPTPSDFIDIKNYSFRIELNDSTDRIAGIAEITAVVKKSSTDFQLDLIGKNNEGKGMQVTDVKHKGASVKFTHQNNKINITLPAATTQNEMIGFSVHYNGIPQDGLIIAKNMFGDRTFFADNWPNRGRNWIPVIDHPADKASVEWQVVAPLHYEVVANGVRQEEIYLNKNQKLTYYKEDADIAPKVMVIGVARFAVQTAGIVNGNIPVETWVYPQNAKAGFSDFSYAVGVLDFFHNHIGPYPYKKLANVQSKTIFGGLENASAIFYFEKAVSGKSEYEMMIAHEIAHQWFGDSASEKDWAHVWLSEGFATYFAMLYAEFTKGEEFRKGEMLNDRVQVISYFKKSPTPIVNLVEKDPMKLLDANSYQKGSWFLHMLRREVGDVAFWNGIRDYYRAYQNSNALTADFQRTMEAASGKDLNLFFQQWVYKAGHPVLDGNWKYDEAKKTLTLNLKQVQKTQIFEFPLEIGILTADKDFQTIEKAYINKESQVVEIKIPSKPTKITLDPNVNLLFDGKLVEK